MVTESVSIELTKMLMDDKITKLQKAFDSLLAEVQKETASIKSAFTEKSSNWDSIRSELIKREKTEAELLAKVQSLKDKSTTLLRAATRTHDLEIYQKNISEP